MRTFTFAFALAFLPLSVLAAQQESAPPSGQQGSAQNTQKDKDQKDKDQEKVPTYRKTVTVVNVQFTVKDNHGLLIPNLAKERFELLEEGKPQTIKYFSAV